MGPWSCFRALFQRQSRPPADEDSDLPDNRNKVIIHFPDQYHVLKVSDENELFFYKFIPRELRNVVPQACAVITPDRDAPRLLPFACQGSIDKRGHQDEIDYERRNGGLPLIGKTLLVMRDIKADMISPRWIDFELGADKINCLRMGGISMESSKRKRTKSELRKLTFSQIKNTLESFLNNHDVVDLIIEELDEIIKTLFRVSGISFAGTSILIAYDAASLSSSHYRVAVKLMSLRAAKLSSEGSIYVLNGLITLREMIKSIRGKEYDLI